MAAEAVGQLAAWAAMAAIDFSHRPLAGIAGEVELIAPLRPGQELDLTVDLESADTDSAVYSGEGRVDGAAVIRLRVCVGPMVPLDDYDDPSAVRERFRLICGQGARPGAFGGIPQLALKPKAGTATHSLHAQLAVPESAPFFADHFPRRALFPGTLLVHSNLQLARQLASNCREIKNGTAWNIRKVTGVKLRTFIPPGADLQLEAKVAEQSARHLVLDVKTLNGRRTVCSAQVICSGEDEP